MGDHPCVPWRWEEWTISPPKLHQDLFMEQTFRFSAAQMQAFFKVSFFVSTQRLTNQTSKILSFEVNQNKKIQGFSSFALTLFSLSNLFQPISLVFQFIMLI